MPRTQRQTSQLTKTSQPSKTIFSKPLILESIRQESLAKPIQLGLCCLNLTLKKQEPSIYASRKMMMKTIQRDGIEVLK